MDSKRKKDNIQLFGDFTLRVYDLVDGKREMVRRFQKRNQITNEGREALLSLMRPTVDLGTPLIDDRIWSLAVGTNGTPPTVSDTESTMYLRFISALDFAGGECSRITTPPNDYYLAISKVIGTGDANGATPIAEAGIFTRGDDPDPELATTKKLYARQVFSPIIKTDTMSITIDWQLGITIQGQ